MLQAVTCALAHLDELDPAQRALGLDRAQVIERTPRIIEFSELGEFIDRPIKTYSTGMVMRLGFAIATQVEPDVLIIERAKDMRQHAGQPAFPGGAIDPTDDGPEAAALREAAIATLHLLPVLGTFRLQHRSKLLPGRRFSRGGLGLGRGSGFSLGLGGGGRRGVVQQRLSPTGVSLGCG